ncbi:uncharacterized protein LOC127137943 [Lathyrus oleraceus]|uniref:uncharacterized protein LOC127137943 n=1 Tax=Pisum sativum TaxID=3888 RepID=UPI0021D1FAD0|nr:uncharacterized protein LOC127137943 [Pisum sativum]
MYPSLEVEQHSEKDDDSSSSEKDMVAEGLCSLGKTVSDKGKSVASKTANASYSEKHDDANDVIDLEDDRSDDQEDNLLHHLKPSVAKRMKTRKGRSVADLMSARKAKKTAGIGPSKSWGKVEVKKRKKTTVRKSPVKVAVVDLDNISFHLEDGAAKWTFVIERRVVVERELGKDVVEVKEVMDLIKAAGLLKTVAGFSQCYEGLVKEFIINIPEDIADKNNKEFGKVFVRGKCITFSPIVINNFLGRKIEGAGELEATDNEVYREITARQPASKVGTIDELKETCKELGEGIRVTTTRKQSLEALIASLEQAEGENIEHTKEAEAHTSSERSANNDETSGNSVSSVDEAASSSSTD